MACPSSSFSLSFLFPNFPFSSSLILKRSLACLLALILELYSKGSFMLSLWGRHYCTALHSEATTEDSKLGDIIRARLFTSFHTNLLLIKLFVSMKLNNNYQPHFAKQKNKFIINAIYIKIAETGFGGSSKCHFNIRSTNLRLQQKAHFYWIWF